ncbi:mitochondrial ATP synthase subunit [Striga asiatica]|uniref:Mitochondrial ATP synthase subunit n=1 Tax=Striga asiatica TaxID=4170 RepID=A0A5A7NYW5_STRAF|nr:mitochondrial ATP synthase subunit [Striga asiatica]
MRKFDPWPVFFKREWNRNWPFLVGFAVTGAIITKFSLGLTEEDAKNSPFVQRHRNLSSIIEPRSSDIVLFGGIQMKVSLLNLLGHWTRPTTETFHRLQKN